MVFIFYKNQNVLNNAIIQKVYHFKAIFVEHLNTKRIFSLIFKDLKHHYEIHTKNISYKTTLRIRSIKSKSM